MKSIRGTLITNFLVVMTVALLCVCAVAYSVTYRTLEDERETAEMLVHQRYEERIRQIREERDLDLLRQVRTLAGLTQSQFNTASLNYYRLFPLGSLTAAVSPHAHLQIPIWAHEGVWGPLGYRVSMAWMRSAVQIQLPEDYLPRDDKSERREFYQITSDWGRVWRSRSIPKNAAPLDVPAELRNGPVFQWYFDDGEIDGVPVRRVILKTPLPRYSVRWPSSPRRRRGQSRPSAIVGVRTRTTDAPPTEFGADERITESILPAVYVQCAWETAPLKGQIAGFRQSRNEEIASLRVEADKTLARLRVWLALITVATIPAVVIGGSLLVRTGLRSLCRVSHAVGKVTERDFHLPINPETLPQELKPIVVKLNQTLGMLGSAIDREKRATADISHELRTPLAALLTTLEVSLRRERTPEKYRETLQDCQEIGRQLSQLVERILLLAKVDAGADQIHPRPIDVSELLNDCAAVARPLAEAHGLEFQYNRNGPVPVTTDPDKLREVVLNLLHNAVEYNRTGGSVWLSSQQTEQGAIVEVRDTGIGIPEERRGEIFERFFRADPARSATGVHAGLGLAIVKEYVDQLGGRIELDSRVNVGSTFRIEVINKPPPATNAPTSAGGGSSERVHGRQASETAQTA